MNVFFDTNILLDHALRRQDTYASEAVRLLELCEQYQLTGLVSTGSWYSLTYVLRKRWGNTNELREKLTAYLSLLRVISTDSGVLREALSEPRRDVEDAYQYFTALRHGAAYFITANIKDFLRIELDALPVLTPDVFLQKFFPNP